jgi:hypothetical protein
VEVLLRTRLPGGEGGVAEMWSWCQEVSVMIVAIIDDYIRSYDKSTGEVNFSSSEAFFPVP